MSQQGKSLISDSFLASLHRHLQQGVVAFFGRVGVELELAHALDALAVLGRVDHDLVALVHGSPFLVKLRRARSRPRWFPPCDSPAGSWPAPLWRRRS